MTGAPTYMTPGLVRWRRATDGPLLVLAIGSLPLLLLELSRNDLPLSDRRFLDIANVFVLVAFAVDYFMELRLASNRREYAKREWTSAVIVVTTAIAIAPGALSVFGVFRILRAAPALRGLIVVLRLLAIGGSAAREGRATLRRRAGTFALSLVGFVWLTSAVAFTLAENVGVDNPQADSFFDALWWSTSTITTVGYGDIYPITTTGRAVGMVTMVVGVAVFAVVTAKVAEFLVKGDSATSTDQVLDAASDD
jgi:voltage-gated potassium channel